MIAPAVLSTTAGWRHTLSTAEGKWYNLVTSCYQLCQHLPRWHQSKQIRTYVCTSAAPEQSNTLGGTQICQADKPGMVP